MNHFIGYDDSEQTVYDQSILLPNSYSSLSRLPLLISVWDHPWFPRSVNTNRRSSDKSPVEHPYSTISYLPWKTAQRLYKKTQRGRFSSCLCLYLNKTQACINRKLTEKLREAYAPLADDCCKAILDAISSNISKLNSGGGTSLFGAFFVSLTTRVTDTDADVRSLAFLSRLTHALHASPFYARFECKMVIGTGTYRAAILIHTADP